MITKLQHSRLELPAITGQSLSNIDRAIACGDLETTVIGRKRWATPKAVERWLAFLAAECAAGRVVKYMARDPNERRTPERAAAERARAKRRVRA
jgi:hypothetical protein